MTGGEIVGWHQRLDEHEFEQAPRGLVTDREAWRAAAHGITKSRTPLSDRTTTEGAANIRSQSNATQ